MVLAKAQQQTIQELPDAKKDRGSFDFFATTARGLLLPQWGTRERERRLRDIFRYDYNWMVQGAFAGIGNVVADTPRRVVAKDKLTVAETKYWKQALKAVRFGEATTSTPDIEYFNSVIEQADFGRGWRSFVKKVTLEYLRHDCGAFIELIAPGNPSRPPTGPVTGFAVLDSLRCVPTGDPEYPVIYNDRLGKFHLLHNTRVIQIVDMPDTDERKPGYGLCSLSRAVSITAREVHMGRYIESSLDDKPAPGIVVASGMNRQERDKAVNAYKTEQSNDEPAMWGRQLWFYSADAAEEASITTVAFTQAPEKFDFKVYTEIDIDALALAIGVDRQDLWQLSGGNIGSGQQSEMLAQKSRGKTIGNLRDEIERAVDSALPEGYDFELQYADPQEDREKAEIATKWTSVAKSLASDLDQNERRMLLANQVEAIRDVITDENGEIKVIEDVSQQNDPAQADPNAPPQKGTPVNQQPGSNLPDRRGLPDNGGAGKKSRDRSESGIDVGWRELYTHAKAIQSTRIDFEDAFADLIESRQKGDINALRFGVLARALLRTYGLKALRDGLEDGGVQPYDEFGAPLPLEADEQSAYSLWLIQQSAYVTAFGGTITSGSEYDGEDRAMMWFNKSIMPMFSTGFNSAAANAMLEFVGDDGEHTCDTCARLKGQRHRSRDWKRKQLRPQIDTTNFVCGGWRCDHHLIRTTERAKGRF